MLIINSILGTEKPRGLQSKFMEREAQSYGWCLLPEVWNRKQASHFCPFIFKVMNFSYDRNSTIVILHSNHILLSEGIFSFVILLFILSTCI